MKEKSTKRRSYNEELLWAIIIILMMFITTLDVVWFGRKGQVTETTNFAASSTTQVVALDMAGTTGYIFVRGDGKVYSDYNCTTSITSIIMPTKTGYKCTGIYSGTTLLISPDGTIDVSMVNNRYKANSGSYTATTNWEAIQTVTLNKNNGSGGTDKIYVSHGKAYQDKNCTVTMSSISVPTKSGYVFSGYYEQASSGKSKIIYANGNVYSNAIYGVFQGTESDYNAIAKWSKLMTIDKNGGNGGPDNLYLESSTLYSDVDLTTSLTTITKPTRSGYAFKGYYTTYLSNEIQIIDENGAVTSNIHMFSSVSGASTTLTAKWEKTGIKEITINNNEGSGGPSKLYYWSGALYSDENATNSVTSVTKPTRSGYAFKGYYTTYLSNEIQIIDENGAVTSNIHMFSSVSGVSTTLTAKWEKTGIKEITINNNEGSGGPSKLYYWSGALYSDENATTQVTSVSIPSKTGYIFQEYYAAYQSDISIIDKNGTVGSSTNLGVLSMVTTINARWTPITYTVKYNGNGATGGSTANSSHTYDVAKALTANGFERKYTVTYNHNYTGSTNTTRTATYTFNGWATSANGAKAYNNSQSVTNLSSSNGATVTLYANWSSASVNYAPTRTGYTFGGWYKEAECTNKVSDAAYIPTSNITVYAKWNANSYTVSYNYNGATGGNTETGKTVTYDSTYGTLPSPTRAYTITFDSKGGSTCNNQTATWNFGGWYNGSTLVKADTKVTTTSNHTLNASWNGGTISLPTPTKTGYTFGGWTLLNGTSVSNSTQFTANTTLYATWTAGSSEVTFNYNGATGNNGTAKKAVTYNEKYGELPSPTRAYTIAFNSNGGSTCNNQTATWSFGGWYNGSTKVTADSTVTTASNHTLTASWSGGTISLPTPTKTGYTFGGWFSESSLTNQVSNSTAYTSNKTLYAKWTANTYTVSYNYNGATGGNTETGKTVTYDSTYGTLPTPTRAYTITFNSNGGNACSNQTATWSFGGWYNGSTLVKADTKVATASNHTVNASWSGGTVRLPTPAKTGYTFGGWFSDSGFKNAVSNSTQFKANTTLYAKWTANTYTVSYNYNGATGGNTETGKTVTYDSTYGTLPSPTRAYTITFDSKGGSTCNSQTATWTFWAWYNGSTIVKADTKVTTVGNHTLTASWQGGTISLPTPTKTGYTFGGWTTSNGTSVSNSTQFTANTTLYATWTAGSSEVTFNYNGATGNNGTAKKAVTYNEKYGDIANHQQEHIQ